jgi:hypothetical protein
MLGSNWNVKVLGWYRRVSTFQEPAMQRARSHSAETPRTPRLQQPDVTPASANDVNQLAIRIHGLKNISVTDSARLTAFLACASSLQHMPKKFVPLLAGELRTACATLPKLQQPYASKALDSVAPHRS